MDLGASRMNNYNNIPEELRLLPQWVVWRGDKVPYNAKTGELANVNDPSTWSDFATAVAHPDCSGVGFVFSDRDNYAFIDMDDTKGDQIALNRQIEIYKEFDSYSETSPSGRGLHIIVRGSVPAGRRRSFIELYSSQRYATFTGNVYNSKPIQDRQELLTRLWQQMGDGPVAMSMYHDQPEKCSDEEVIEQASRAANGDKFQRLFSGEWSADYPSQSEADFAIIDILAFYTQNRNQIGRIFRLSALGKRSKASRSDYLSWMINKSFDRMLPPIDFDGFRNQLELKLVEGRKQAIVIEPTLPGIALPLVQNPETGNPGSVQIPPGLLGELAQFIYSAAPRPVPEIALAGAIGLMAGICGRAYNISGTGLNHYVLVLTKTGRGKEAAASGIDKLMNSIKTLCPTSSRFRGPAIISSGQALIRHLATVSNCFVSVLGEFGITIERISNKRAVPSDKMLYQMLLDLYNKSGHGQTLQASAYSKKENDVAGTNSPALSIFGESTHKIFYEALNEDMIAAGLLPRFLIIDYEGDRVLLNEAHENIFPQREIVEKLSALVAHAETTMYGNRVIQINRTPEAVQMLRDFDKYTTALINKEKNDVIEELWNRAHMKVLRLAGLVAIGVNYIEPLVTAEHVKYAMNLIQNDIHILSDKFRSGMIGSNSEENKQKEDLARVIRDWVVKSWDDNKKYCQSKSDATLHDEKIVPYAYLNKRLSATSSFKNDPMRATNALKKTIQVFVDSDRIREIGKNDPKLKALNTYQRCFIIVDTSLLEI